jgi:predicted RNase H-like nuclease (RuvC/YqgF family)
MGWNSRFGRNKKQNNSRLSRCNCKGEEVIIPNKWYPMVQARHDIQTAAFDKAVEKVQEEYKEALKAHKTELAIAELELELYNKKARVNQLEMQMFKPNKLDFYV